MNNLIEAYKILNNVVNKGGFSNIEMKNLPPECDRAFVTRLIYGTIENDIMLEYYIQKLSPRPPKPNVAIILKIGLYLLIKMSTPEYAAINNTVTLAKEIGKGGVAGYVNAVLRGWREVELPQGEGAYALSIRYSYPKWVVQKLIAQYGKELAICFLEYQEQNATHIRFNAKTTTAEQFAEIIKEEDIHRDIKASMLGYYVTHTTLDALKEKCPEKYTAQSLASMLVCNSFSGNPTKILDVCAAPGGKSIYLSELFRARVTACDVHPHRVELIKAYAHRMKNEDVTATLFDATEFDSAFECAFDAVLCDVPCSGFGVAGSKPDIKLNKEQADISSLADIQYKILTNSARYLKSGGELVYSTCTVFAEENEQVVSKFLEQNPDFSLAKIELPIMPKYKSNLKNAIQFLPCLDKIGGYFIAKLKKSPT